ncbi:phosphoenolpyruvate--protein phosphotransferase [Aeromicrobium sp. HA]|uniref:phosphoenolpyruvate--protein phosphotransferase n=1 Tax=Aeromicrobium sp. HA TaxID=3009077 RepID=UPI0022AEDF21|nr:putative PEP-binding protein [Aeromicrobium sp. HA]
MSTVYSGTAVVPGIGVGPVVRPAPRPTAPEHEDSADASVTTVAFGAAAAEVARRLRARSQSASGAASEVLAATAGLAEDRGLATFVAKHAAQGAGPATATTAAIEELAAMFTAAGGLMAERVTDLYDVRDRIVAELLELPEPGIPVPDEPSVLLADDLAPADTAGLDPSRIVAIATKLGGSTSHTAIIARQLGIPCVVAVTDLAAVEAGARVAVDGTTGTVTVDPDEAQVAELIEADRRTREAAAGWTGPGRTSDGHAVQILANVQDGAGARVAAEQPIEGVGLFRTELSFLDRATEPSVDEQAAIYAEVFEAMGDKKVIVRTLDAGSDKPLAFANQPDEPNPALGVRGLRIGLATPEMLDRQLDGIAAAAGRTGADVRVMAPMVTTESEAQWFAERVRARGLQAGIMIETPSTVLLADRLFRHLDFVSIGTNDLSQYTFAADRMAPTLSDLTDPWQPALLASIKLVADAGRRAGKPVGVCGEAAAHPLLACVLTGLGVTSLSCAATAVRPVGAKLAQVTLAQCEEAADAALAAFDASRAAQAAAEILA